MARRHVLLAVAVLAMTGCSGPGAGDVADSQAPSSTEPSPATNRPGGTDPGTTLGAVSADDPDACEWVTDETVALAIGGEATTVEPELDGGDDRRGCSWRNATVALSVDFVRFQCCGRSVEAELIRIRGSGVEPLVTVAGVRGAFRGPGVWYGETPLDQYGMAEIRLIHVDGSDPDEGRFEAIVAAVLGDLVAAEPAVPW